MKKERLSCEKARNICIVKSLAKLGHFPSSTTEKEAWFLSPLRSETQASFKVSKIRNSWYDFGMGKGGNLIDLVCLINDCKVKEALQYLQQDKVTPYFNPPKKQPLKKRKIQITAVEPLSHAALINYLKSRRIPVKIALRYCYQVRYRWKDKQYFAIGLENHKGGWEFRNKYFKNSSSPKTFSFFEKGSKNLLITEGMFDFLSLASMNEKLVKNSDAVVLNSLAFIEKIKSLIPKYKQVLLYLDNDPAGIKATGMLLNLYPNITDKSDSYKPYKDLNEKLKNEGL
ncbi:toprim domain-containing protein [Salegentibacter sp. F14]